MGITNFSSIYPYAGVLGDSKLVLDLCPLLPTANNWRLSNPAPIFMYGVYLKYSPTLSDFRAVDLFVVLLSSKTLSSCIGLDADDLSTVMFDSSKLPY